MNIQLSRPLVFIDLETTGLSIAKDRIVELSALRLNTNGEKSSLTMRINPEMPIPAESSAIHGIYDKDVANEPTFKEAGKEIKKFIGNADLAGYNSNKFDIPLLVEEFLRVEIEFDMTKRQLIDVQNIFHKMEKRTLEAAYKFYCQKELINAHSAEADVIATFEVLEAQLDRYPNLEPSTNFLSEFSTMRKNVDLAGSMVYNSNNEAVFNFGKHKGKRVADVFESEPSYYSWMMNADFTRETKQCLTHLMLKQKNTHG